MWKLGWCWLLVIPVAPGQEVGRPLPAWTPAVLDIHHSQTGPGNAAFLVMPDGKTPLVDTGSVPERAGLELGPPHPNASQTTAGWIAKCVLRFRAAGAGALDYALVPHYHDDDMGAIPELAGLLPIRTLIDRGDNPEPPKFPSVRASLEWRRDFGGKHIVLVAGRKDQIVSDYPEFEVRGMAANGEAWPGRRIAHENAVQSENNLSLALLVRYGDFRYFTGGDLAGFDLDKFDLDRAGRWNDMETPVARAVVIPAWHASHPDHGVLRRLFVQGGPEVYLTSLPDASKAVFRYLVKGLRSTEGHLVVRVEKGGGSYRYCFERGV